MSYSPPTIAEQGGLEPYLTKMGFNYDQLVLMHDADNYNTEIAKTLHQQRLKAGKGNPTDRPPHPNTVKHWRQVLVMERGSK